MTEGEDGDFPFGLPEAAERPSRGAGLARAVGIVAALGVVGGLVAAALLTWMLTSAGVHDDGFVHYRFAEGQRKAVAERLRLAVGDLNSLTTPAGFSSSSGPTTFSCGGDSVVSQPGAARDWHTTQPQSEAHQRMLRGVYPRLSAHAQGALESLARELVALGWQRKPKRLDDPGDSHLTKEAAGYKMDLWVSGYPPQPDFPGETLTINTTITHPEPCAIE